MPGRIALPPLGLSGKLYLWGLVILLFAFAVLASAAWFIAGNQARQQMESDIDASLKSFQTEFEEKVGDLKPIGSWLVEQPSFVQEVQARDNAGLVAFLSPWIAARIVDSVTVCDSSGLVLAQVRVDQAPRWGESILNDPGVSEALKAETSSGLERDKFDRLQGRLIMPIYSERAGAPIGVLRLGFFVDGDFLTHLSRTGSAEGMITLENQIRATTLTDPPGETWIGRSPPAEVVVAAHEGRPSGPVVLNLGQAQYLFKFNPLQSPTPRLVGMYGMGISLASMQAQRVELFRALGIGLLVALIAVAGLGYVFARAFTSPIRALETAAQSLARGDLSTAIAVSNKDELGELAQQLEAIRGQLQSTSRAATLEKERLNAILRAIEAAVVITDKDQHILMANPAAEALLRRNLHDLLQQPLQSMFNGASGTDHSLSNFWTTGGSDTTIPGLVIQGRFPLRSYPQVMLHILSRPVELGSESIGYAHLLQDVTIQEKLILSKDEFVMNLAHELRSPLASLRALIDLLTEDYGVMNERDSRLLLQALRRAIVRFQRMVENLIDIGTVQAGRFQVRPIPNMLEKIVHDAISQVELQLQASAHSLQVSLEDDSVIVLADWPRLVQVMVNLLTNASKYSPKGTSILLSSRQVENMVRVDITDHGPGIAPDDQRHLFERFYRVKRADDDGIGIGLGLALAKAIIEGHGGEIGLESQLGQGTTFWFTLPRVE